MLTMTPTRCERFSCVRPRGHAGRHQNLRTVVRSATPRILGVFGRLGMTKAAAAELARIAIEYPEELKDAVVATLVREDVS